MNGEDMHESFIKFLQGDYFQLVQESSDAGAAFEAETAVMTQPPSFRPMVDPEYEVGKDEESVRRSLLRRASADDHDFAVKEVEKMYMEFLAKCTEKQRNILPRIATPKFAASKYYDLLQQRVGNSADGQCGNGPRNDCTLVLFQPAHPTHRRMRDPWA